MAKIVFESVTKVFGEEIAIDDLSFECNDGEFFVLFGPSGAGKTTTMNLISGLEEATSGRIWIGDKVVNKIEPRFRDVAYAFENYSLYPHLNVYENICFPLKSPIRKHEFTQEKIDVLVREITATLQINHLLERSITQLSGGQKQRVALARTMIRNPAVYLLDEAIAHLDAKLRHSIRATLKGYQEEKSVTTIYATPDQLDAVAMCDRMIIIRSGKMQQIGNADDVYQFPVNEFVATCIGYPPMNVLPARLISEGDEVFIRLNGIDLTVPEEMKMPLKQRVKHQEIRLGIRPNDMGLNKGGDTEDVNMAGELSMIEHYGDFCVLHVQVERYAVKVKLEAGTAVEVGEKVGLTTDINKVYIFTSDGEKTIWPARE
ncbi:MAG: ABC transporter ATP-binding protein [Proteobacteria bacterium]|nr:ABC transporter ATP-binding protein [Pseudomonadota bacterium]